MNEYSMTNGILPDIKLQFNLDHPSFEECYLDGYECAKAEMSESDNPYKEGSKENEQWAEGWWAGFYAEEPLFQSVESEVNEELSSPANDSVYHERFGDNFIVKLLEITGVLAVSAMLGYQVIELVA